MTKHHKERTHEFELRTTAEPMQVWEAWAKPERVKDWFVDDAEGSPEAGQTMRWDWNAYGMKCPLKVVASEPGRRFAVEWPAPDGNPRLWDVTIEREGGE